MSLIIKHLTLILIHCDQQPPQPSPMQQSPEGTENEYASEPVDRPPSASSSPTQVFLIMHKITQNSLICKIHKKILLSVGLAKLSID